MHRCIATLLIAFLLPVSLIAQKAKDTGAETDSIQAKPHSPGKAALYSALVPGLGQIYNKKYWKLPIVYAGYGVMTYFIVFNADYYMTYQAAYIEKVNGVTGGNYADLVNKYTEDQLMSGREYYRRNLEISVLLTVLWYSLTILDASVDAHLQTFDISKDLSLRVAPAALPLPDTPQPGAGIRLSLRF